VGTLPQRGSNAGSPISKTFLLTTRPNSWSLKLLISSGFYNLFSYFSLFRLNCIFDLLIYFITLIWSHNYLLYNFDPLILLVNLVILCFRLRWCVIGSTFIPLLQLFWCSLRLVRSWIGLSSVDPQTMSDHFLQFTYSSGGLRARRSFL
jgi:hypothetical protein